MNFELNKEYKFIVSNDPSFNCGTTESRNRKTIKRIKIVAFPIENEAVVELIGAKRYYQGMGLPVRGRLYLTKGNPTYMLTENKKYNVMKVL
jgi:hypothetical protein